MLRELDAVRQHPEEYRRWFSDAYFDLIVWYDTPGGPPQGFQLCTDRGGDEHALTWHAPDRISYHRVDDGEPNASTNQSPLLVPDGTCPIETLQKRFAEAAAELEPAVRQCVAGVLHAIARGDLTLPGSLP